MKEVIVDVIELEEYYKLADKLANDVIRMETARGLKNYEKLLDKGAKADEEYFINQTIKNAYQISIIVSNRFLKTILNRMTSAEEQLLRDVLKKEGFFDTSQRP